MRKDIVLILGARSDIGKAVMHRFAKAGYDIELAARNADSLDKEKLDKRETLFIECYNHDILNLEKPTETVLYKVAINKKWKLMLPNNDLVVRNFKDPQENYYGFYSNQIQLFDMENDPNEQNNLVKQYPEIVNKMRSQIDNWWQPLD